MTKEKGKAHPMAGHLRPTEDVLWILTVPKSSSSADSPHAGYAFSLISMFVGSMLAIGFTMMSPLMVILVALGLFIVSAVPVILLWLAVRHFKSPPKPDAVYAITSERLLYRTDDIVLDLPLERVGTIALHDVEGTHGSLNFGRLFVKWPHIPDPDSVKALIQQARTKRLLHLPQETTDSAVSESYVSYEQNELSHGKREK